MWCVGKFVAHVGRTFRFAVRHAKPLGFAEKYQVCLARTGMGGETPPLQRGFAWTGAARSGGKAEALPYDIPLRLN